MKSCKFFAQGACKFGASCNFRHDTSSNEQSFSTNDVVSKTAKLYLNGDSSRRQISETNTQECRFFLQGKCSRGDNCPFLHPSASSNPKRLPLEATPDNISPISSDSRATIPCTFFSRPGGCKNGVCPFLHSAAAQIVDNGCSQALKENTEEVSNRSW